MSTEKTTKIQQQIAYWVFEHAPRDWSKCCIYIELMPVNGEMENNWSTVWFDSNNEQLTEVEIPAIEALDLNDLFIDLNNAVADINKRWTTCKAKVTSDGRFNFDFGYDRPPRLKWKTTDDLLYHPDYENF